jgi:hypothetical protein
MQTLKLFVVKTPSTDLYHTPQEYHIHQKLKIPAGETRDAIGITPEPMLADFCSGP